MVVARACAWRGVGHDVACMRDAPAVGDATTKPSGPIVSPSSRATEGIDVFDSVPIKSGELKGAEVSHAPTLRVAHDLNGHAWHCGDVVEHLLTRGEVSRPESGVDLGGRHRRPRRGKSEVKVGHPVGDRGAGGALVRDYDGIDVIVVAYQHLNVLAGNGDDFLWVEAGEGTAVDAAPAHEH